MIKLRLGDITTWQAAFGHLNVGNWREMSNWLFPIHSIFTVWYWHDGQFQLSRFSWKWAWIFNTILIRSSSILLNYCSMMSLKISDWWSRGWQAGELSLLPLSYDYYWCHFQAHQIEQIEYLFHLCDLCWDRSTIPIFHCNDMATNSNVVNDLLQNDPA